MRNGYSLGKDLGSRQDAFLGTGGMRQRKTLGVSEVAAKFVMGSGGAGKKEVFESSYAKQPSF